MTMSEDEKERVRRTESWLRSLARDVIEHESCEGCRQNAAQALAHIGSLEDLLDRLDMEDPRVAHDRVMQQRLAEQPRTGPPKMTMNLHLTALLSGTDPALVKQVSDAVNRAVRDAIDRVPGASHSSSTGTAELA